MKKKIVKKEKVKIKNKCCLCKQESKYRILVGSDAGKDLCEECMTKYTGDYI